MENKHIEQIDGGLVCDNQKCDYENKEILSENYKDWLNKPCPKCGENLLTDEDLDNFLKVSAAANLVNSFSEEELEKLSELLGHNPNLNSDFLKDAEGLELLSSKGKIAMTVSTHKEIKAVQFKQVDGKKL